MAEPDFLKKETKGKGERGAYECLYYFLQYGLLLADWCASVKAVILQKELFEDKFW